MRCNLLLLVAVAIGFGIFTQVNAQTDKNQGPLRGEMAAPPTDDLELEATLETVKLDIIISEIEDAGFALDVEEGFDEEWEEDIWVSADADEVEPLLIVADESDLMDVEEMVLQDELTEDWEEVDWENPEAVLEESASAEDETLLEGGLWQESEATEEEGIALLDGFDDGSEEWEEETAWWAVDDVQYDESWEDLRDEWELEALEDVYEADDLEYLEMMYGTE
ncbi:MAG: hypothetical protein AAGN35_14395 [Bacteroidota bacterium]